MPSTPRTLPDASAARLASMLASVGPSFASGDAYAAAREAGHHVSERTLLADLNRAAAAGVIRRTGGATWRKVAQGGDGAPAAPTPREAGAGASAGAPVPWAVRARLRLACALLSAGEWRSYATDGMSYAGPDPAELRAAVDRYADALGLDALDDTAAASTDPPA